MAEPSWQKAKITFTDKVHVRRRWWGRKCPPTTVEGPVENDALEEDNRLRYIADNWNGESQELRVARTELYKVWPSLARVIDLAIGEGLPDAPIGEKQP